MKQLISALFFLFIFSNINAQKVSGAWYGIGKVNKEGSHSNYLVEIIIENTGKGLKGKFNYYFKEAYFEHDVKVNFNSATRKLTFSAIPIAFYNSVKAATGIDIEMHGEFVLFMSKAETALIGKLIPDPQYKYTSPEINIKLHRPSIEKAVFELPEPDEQVKETKTVEAPKKDTVSKQEKAFTQRAVIEQHFIEVENDSVRFEIYDNGEIDNDTISLFVNKKILLSKERLSNKPIKVIIKVNTENITELSVFAENLGDYPPNSALVIMYDGNKRYEFNISSTYISNGTIRIKKKKKTEVDKRYIF